MLGKENNTLGSQLQKLFPSDLQNHLGGIGSNNQVCAVNLFQVSVLSLLRIGHGNLSNFTIST